MKLIVWGINKVYYEQLFKRIFLISLLLMLVTAYYKDQFPEPKEYDLSLLTPPQQTITTREPFRVDANKQHYDITPKFDYDLIGVVVSYHDASSFIDVWHYDRWKDFINVRDLCVDWEPNVGSGIYQSMSFSSDNWTCWFSWPDRESASHFDMSALSNNHTLTANNQIKAALLSAEKGDVIHFKGVLAEYSNKAAGFFRGTSIRRTDTGNGACETVYLDEFDIIKKANPILRKCYSFAKWTTIFSLIGFLIMFVKTPFRQKN